MSVGLGGAAIAEVLNRCGRGTVHVAGDYARLHRPLRYDAGSDHPCGWIPPFSNSRSLLADAIDEAGLPDDCVLHGLRKCAARKLADLGLSEETIKSITGHVTSRMVAKYVKGANQRKLATQGMKVWENAK